MSPLPSEAAEEHIQFSMPTRVSEVVSVDFFGYAGHTYIVYADKQNCQSGTVSLVMGLSYGPVGVCSSADYQSAASIGLYRSSESVAKRWRAINHCKEDSGLSAKSSAPTVFSSLPPGQWIAESCLLL